MPRPVQVPFSLVRKRIRASYNKINVYNAITWRKNRPLNTMFRQLFFAKQESRSYHGDRLTETQFRNVFRKELTSVSPLQSKAKQQKDQREKEIPHALQTFVALERRLDFAVFRSMFATSVRQAAQFVVRGAVKVNGVKIKHPGYVLRAGDLFSVDQQRVLQALGRSKPTVADAIEQTNKVIRRYNRYLARCRKNPEKMWQTRDVRRKRHAAYNQRYEAKALKRLEAHNAAISKKMHAAIDAVKPRSVLVSTLLSENTDAKAVSLKRLVAGHLPPAGADYTAEEAKKVAGRYFDKHEAGESGVVGKSDVKKAAADLAHVQQEKLRVGYTAQMRKAGEKEPYDPAWIDRLPEKIEEIDKETSAEDLEKIKVQLPFSQGKTYGLTDASRPYFTPWTPRQFLAPMAVLPHHIEVSFETCHAVYLRDPVARPDHSEVISPFALDMHERARMWYNSRRRKNLPRD